MPITNILVKETGCGLQCEIICEYCKKILKLSSYKNVSTSRSTFSTYNFLRHVRTIHTTEKNLSEPR